MQSEKMIAEEGGMKNKGKEADNASGGKPDFNGQLVRFPVCLKKWQISVCNLRGCTSAKLLRKGYIQSLQHSDFFEGIVLVVGEVNEPFISPADRQIVSNYGMAVVDCWSSPPESAPYAAYRRDNVRCIPPVNNWRLGRYELPSAAAFAIALYIVGFKQAAKSLCGNFPPGFFFLDANLDVLELYWSCKNAQDVAYIARDFEEGPGFPEGGPHDQNYNNNCPSREDNIEHQENWQEERYDGSSCYDDDQYEESYEGDPDGHCDEYQRRNNGNYDESCRDGQEGQHDSRQWNLDEQVNWRNVCCQTEPDQSIDNDEDRDNDRHHDDNHKKESESFEREESLSNERRCDQEIDIAPVSEGEDDTLAEYDMVEEFDALKGCGDISSF